MFVEFCGMNYSGAAIQFSMKPSEMKDRQEALKGKCSLRVGDEGKLFPAKDVRAVVG